MRRALFLSLFLALPGCLPERDNPNDSANRPTARLTVVERTREGVCVPVGSLDADTGAISALSRGRCIGLDARDSSDPEGQDLDFRFFWSTGGTATFDVEHLDGDVEGVASLEPDWVRATLPARRAVSFGVEVRAGGGRDVVTVPFVLLNDRPVAKAPPPRFLRLGGLPWSPGASYAVEFRPDATDPDGDPPTEYCWTFQSVGSIVRECATSSSAPAFVRSVDSGSIARLVATLVVSDGDLESEPASTYVLVVPSFAMARDAEDGFYALDPIAPLPVPDNLDGRVISYGPGDDRVFATVAHYAQDRIELRDTITGNTLDEIAVDGNFAAPRITFDTARARVWASGITTNNTFQAVMRSYSVEGDTFTPEIAPFALGSFLVNNVAAPVVVDDGSVFAVSPYVGGEQHVVRVQPLSAPPYYQVEDVYVTNECCFGNADFGGYPGTPRARPGHAEMWIPQERYGNVESYLARFAVGEEPQLFPTDGYRIGAIAWATSSHLWAMADNQGALLLDADLLVAGVPLGESILVHHPEVTTAGWVECDRGTASCVAGGASEGWRFDGEHLFPQPGMVDRSFQAGVPFTGEYLDQLGAIWGDGPQRVLTTRPDRALFEFHRLADVAVADPLSGGVWISADGPLLRIAADGSLLRVVDLARIDGVVGPIPSFFYLLPEPGGALWGVSPPTGELMRVNDPTADIPSITTIQFGSLDDMPFFLPVRTPAGPAAWHSHADYPTQVALVTTNASVTYVFNVPEGGALSAAVSPLDGSLCLSSSTSATTPSTIHLRRIALGGGVTDFGAIGSADPVTAVAHSRTANGSDDVCWMASANPAAGAAAAGCTAGNEGRIRAWRGDGTPVVDLCVSGKVVDLFPTHENELQLSTTKAGEAGLSFAVRRSGTFAVTPFEAPSSTPLRFVR